MAIALSLKVSYTNIQVVQIFKDIDNRHRHSAHKTHRRLNKTQAFALRSTKSIRYIKRSADLNDQVQVEVQTRCLFMLHADQTYSCRSAGVQTVRQQGLRQRAGGLVQQREGGPVIQHPREAQTLLFAHAQEVGPGLRMIPPPAAQKVPEIDDLCIEAGTFWAGTFWDF